MKSFVVNDEIHKKVKDYCKENGFILNTKVERILEDFINSQTSSNKN